jgi:hypothetical protein
VIITRSALSQRRHTVFAIDQTATAVLGKPAEQEGDMVEYAFSQRRAAFDDGPADTIDRGLETAPEVKLQMLEDGRAVTYGEMILLDDVVNRFLKRSANMGSLSMPSTTT